MPRFTVIEHQPQIQVVAYRYTVEATNEEDAIAKVEAGDFAQEDFERSHEVGDWYPDERDQSDYGAAPGDDHEAMDAAERNARAATEERLFG